MWAGPLPPPPAHHFWHLTYTRWWSRPGTACWAASPPAPLWTMSWPSTGTSSTIASTTASSPRLRSPLFPCRTYPPDIFSRVANQGAKCCWFVCFWASRIRFRHYLYGAGLGVGSFHYQAKKKLRKTLITSLWIFLFEDWCKCTFKK
jgi:hypothetical protein